MNEAGFWHGFVRPALHHPERGRVAWKVPAELRTGLPDVWYALGAGSSGWLELKYLRDFPKRTETPIALGVSLEQRAHLLEVVQGGQRAYALIGTPDDVWLIAPGDTLDRLPLLAWRARAVFVCPRTQSGQGALRAFLADERLLVLDRSE